MILINLIRTLRPDNNNDDKNDNSQDSVNDVVTFFLVTFTVIIIITVLSGHLLAKYSRSGAHHLEPSTPILDLCHGVLTERFIDGLLMGAWSLTNFSRGRVQKMYEVTRCHVTSIA